VRSLEYLKSPGCKTLNDKHVLSFSRWNEAGTHLECSECGELFVVVNERTHARLLKLTDAVAIGRVKRTEVSQ